MGELRPLSYLEVARDAGLDRCEACGRVEWLNDDDECARCQREREDREPLDA